MVHDLQVSNLFFEFDGRRPSGSRIVRESVHIGDEPLDVHRKYVVGTKHYLLSGRDGFDCFTEVCAHSAERARSATFGTLGNHRGCSFHRQQQFLNNV